MLGCKIATRVVLPNTGFTLEAVAACEQYVRAVKRIRRHSC